MGFRTDELYGERIMNPISVISHEIFQLENTDILDTLSSTILKDTKLGSNLEKLSKVMRKEIIDDEISNFLNTAFNDTSIATEFVTEILNAIEKITNIKVKFCLWLCDSISDLIYSYFDGNKNIHIEIKEYENGDIILSDLGTEGKLYGYSYMPFPIGNGIL